MSGDTGDSSHGSLVVFDEPGPMRTWSERQRRAGRRIALVPTMGALHDGHLALICEARQHADVVVVSIFVNPLQFGVRSDFDSYPRPIDDDLDACRAAGVDAVYAPTAARMYPTGFQTHVEPGALAERLEGEHRPGHFRGVATVVTKLFGAIRPDAAVFGQKDAQQLAIVRQTTIDLDLGVDIVAMPTVREHDGLAMSSRNRRLDPQQRIAAVCIIDGLRAAERLVTEHVTSGGGPIDALHITAAVAGVIDAEPLARLEHVAVVDALTLTDLAHVDVAAAGDALILAAAWFDDVRLIDNLVVSGRRPQF